MAGNEQQGGEHGEQRVSEQRGVNGGYTGRSDRQGDPAQADEREQRALGKGTNKQRYWIGITALILLAGFFFFENKSTVSVNDIRSGIGKGISAGAVLASTDEGTGLTPRDYTIAMNDESGAGRMLIWDFAAEDGDVVTVKADGVIIAENLTLLNNPFAISVPVPSVVEIIGVKDGGGGITYGVKFPGAISNNAYFNAAPVGSSNKYTITLNGASAAP
ncbi:hypothetical protein DNH61_01120 [Paenibacillus sambharensis]|uniref:Uncharacterized protein n=1 Tax=Paenibacillus sambharensis TaxID=1803190 RepID=A0A2W1M1H6_9BACL|nr:hypothetical protein [Paenibacillus sambharensis]PZD97507.1 hypothetical protein DNH61_01120 [Paenibacillus sambharensis]